MEGPSIHLLSETLQIFVNEKVIDAFGNAKFEKKTLINQKIKEIYPFGKKLIIQFESCALVTHFLMYGSYRIDEQRDISPRIALITSNHALYFYNCSSKYIETNNFKKDLDLEIDILSTQWNLAKVSKKIKKLKNSTIDDILLDQSIFAGVGNIIKNESLFLSKVSPEIKIKNLSAKKLKEIALNTRSFSQIFLSLIKKQELKKHLQIYHQRKCPICGSRIIRKKTGITNRWSYICPKCQHSE